MGLTTGTTRSEAIEFRLKNKAEMPAARKNRRTNPMIVSYDRLYTYNKKFAIVSFLQENGTRLWRFILFADYDRNSVNHDDIIGFTFNGNVTLELDFTSYYDADQMMSEWRCDLSDPLWVEAKKAEAAQLLAWKKSMGENEWERWGGEPWLRRVSKELDQDQEASGSEPPPF